MKNSSRNDNTTQTLYESCSHNDIMQFSVNSFPAQRSLLKESSLPWSVVVQPLASKASLQHHDEQQTVHRETENLLSKHSNKRCKGCGAFLNTHCLSQDSPRRRWICSLCQKANDAVEQEKEAVLPTTSSLTYELEYSDNRMTYVAIVDESGDTEFLNHTCIAINAALQALPENAWFGLITLSDRIGIYNLSSVAPFEVVYHHHEKEVLLKNFLGTVQLSIAGKQAVTQAVESIAARQNNKRALGSVLSAVIKYFSHSNVLGARTFVFLSGIPNEGVGSLENRFLKDHSGPISPSLQCPSISFYSDLVQQVLYAASLCIDFLIISDLAYIDAASLYPLSRKTGGKILYYNSTEASNLPQDLYRHLTTSVSKVLLRIRTSCGFRVRKTSSCGHFIKDEEYQDLWHVAGCNIGQSFTFDFEHTSNTIIDSLPVVQVSFSYYFHNKHFVKVETKKLYLAQTVAQMYSSVNLNAMSCVMVQKSVKKSLSGESETSIREWLMSSLVSCVAAYNQHVNYNRMSELDTKFLKCPELRTLLPQWYGLLNSNLVASSSLVHPDVKTFSQSTFSGSINVNSIKTALYPTIYAFSDENTLDNVLTSLSMHELNESGAKYFLFNAYTKIYFQSFRDNPLTNRECLISKMLQRFKNTCHVAPRVICLHDVSDESFDARFIRAVLIDDHSYVSGGTFSTFERDIKDLVSSKLGLVL